MQVGITVAIVDGFDVSSTLGNIDRLTGMIDVVLSNWIILPKTEGSCEFIVGIYDIDDGSVVTSNDGLKLDSLVDVDNDVGV